MAFIIAWHVSGTVLQTVARPIRYAKDIDACESPQSQVPLKMNK